MKIATWNINSVRLRLDLVLRLLSEEKPDILCLQETKTPDEFFPTEAFAKAGYKHQHICGMKGYNGVAILSRKPITLPQVRHWCEKQDCRHIHARLEDGTELHCVYVPAGGDIPDPKANVKFAHKLQFLDELAGWWKMHPHAKRRILVGDLNVAPLEHDVWSHKQMLGVVSHTPVEVEKLAALQKAFAGVDAPRHFVPAGQKLYSWWSYRAADWRASDRGRRLDHIWVSKNLAGDLKKTRILKEARGWTPKPSDHVPVIAEFG
ncbi:MAG: exodeoxyribonuclease III [Proteobacteria bacterium]|nr:exodeoxyribonuclease III [Pseudomonadota bacterium]